LSDLPPSLQVHILAVAQRPHDRAEDFWRIDADRANRPALAVETKPATALLRRRALEQRDGCLLRTARDLDIAAILLGPQPRKIRIIYRTAQYERICFVISDA
jgi:hypothetical protein